LRRLRPSDWLRGMFMTERKRKRKAAAEKKSVSRLKGRGNRVCRFCGNARGLVRKYGLNACRRCFRERAEHIGFRKF